MQIFVKTVCLFFYLNLKKIGFEMFKISNFIKRRAKVKKIDNFL